MKKYKLLKDLPFAKAGDMVEMWSDGIMAFVGEPNLPRFNKKDVRMFPLWFEEVKEYYVINPVFGEVLKTKDNSYSDLQIRNMRELGVLFDTWLEADRKLAYLKAKAIIKQDTNGFKPDWSNREQYKYYGYWGLREHKPIWNVSNMAKTVNIYFKSREELESSFEKHPKEWKTYLTYEQ